MTTRKSIAFGAKAELYARRLPDDAPVLVTDYAGVREAVSFAYAARWRGERFATAIVLEDERTVIARAVAAQIERSYASFDERRAALDSLAAGSLNANGLAVRDWRAYDPKVLGLLRIFVRLGFGLLVRSWREQQRLMPLLRFSPERITRFAPPRALSFAPAGETEGNALVIWAPALGLDELALWRLSIAELRLPVIFACAQDAAPAGNFEFFGPARHAEALRRAIGFIDTHIDDPGDARFLARLGKGVAVAAPAGADEYLTGALSYDPADRASIANAAFTVVGHPAPYDGGEGLHVVDWTAPETPGSTAKISVIIPTFKRTDLLVRAVGSIERQTHRNLEIIVVNDAGPDLSGLAWSDRVRLVQLTTNVGAWGAMNAGVAFATGKYVVFTDDDDAFFPDHLARLVYALENSQAAAAHTDMVSVFVERNESGAYVIVGYDIDFDRAAEPWKMLSTDVIGFPTVMLRRAVLDEVGLADVSLPLAKDYELWLRILARHDWVHVEAASAVYSRRNDKGAVSDNSMVTITQFQKYVPALQQIYERYAVPGRPAIEADRQNVLNAYRAMGTQPPMEPPVRLEPSPFLA